MRRNSIYPAPGRDGSTGDRWAPPTRRSSRTSSRPFRDQSGTAVAYTETDSLALYDGLPRRALSRPPPDLLISSASDLQIKLANDGHALAYRTGAVEALPDWAQWRGEVIGFTYEPAVIVYSPTLLPPGTQPRTHRELAELSGAAKKPVHGRVATYDIARSGVGYLLAAQDQQISSQFWRLVSVIGRVRVILSDSSSEILDWVAAGDIAIGYNVLGSYAFARQAAGAPVGIVVPEDYVLVLTRTMLIPRSAPNPTSRGASWTSPCRPADSRWRPGVRRWGRSCRTSRATGRSSGSRGWGRARCSRSR
jgi:two-component system, OmpR family, sensor histidine kinase TctE